MHLWPLAVFVLFLDHELYLVHCQSNASDPNARTVGISQNLLEQLGISFNDIIAKLQQYSLTYPNNVTSVTTIEIPSFSTDINSTDGFNNTFDILTSCDVVLGNYSDIWTQIISWAEIPYFVFETDYVDYKPPYLFDICFNIDTLAFVTAQLFKEESISKIYILQDSSPDNKMSQRVQSFIQIIASFPKFVFTITTFNSKDPDSIRQDLLALNLTIDSSQAFLVLLSDVTGFLVPIIEQALHLSYLESNVLFLIAEIVDIDSTIVKTLQNYAHVDARLTLFNNAYPDCSLPNVVEPLIISMVNFYIAEISNETVKTISAINNAALYTDQGTNLLIEFTNNVFSFQGINLIGPSELEGAPIQYGQWSLKDTSAGTFQFEVNTFAGYSAEVNVYVLSNSMPYFANSSSGQLNGYIVSVVQMLISAFDPNVTYHYPADNTFGRTSSSTPNVPSSWGGIFGSIVGDRKGIAIVPLFLNQDRMQYVAFTSSFATVSLSILINPPNDTVAKYFNQLSPFSNQVWYTIMSSYFLLALAFKLIDIISPNKGRTHHHGITAQNSIFFVFSSLSMSRVKLKPTWFSGRIFLVAVWFCSFVIVAAYGGSMLAFLLIPSSTTATILSFEDLFNNNSEYKWSYWYNTDIVNYIQSLANETEPTKAMHYNGYKKAISKWGSQAFVHNETEMMALLNDNVTNWAIINDNFVNNYYVNTLCYLKIVGNPELGYSYGITMNKNFSLLDALQNQMKNWVLSGDLQTLQIRLLQSGNCPTQVNFNSYSQMKLEDMAGLFIFLGGVILLSFTIAALEFAVYKLKLCCQRLAKRRLVFGKTYTAKVMDVRADGIFITLGNSEEMHYLTSKQLHSSTSKVYTPEELGITPNIKIRVVYQGNHPRTGAKQFKKL